LWFRLLRTLLDELNTPLSACGTYAGYSAKSGKAAGIRCVLGKVCGDRMNPEPGSTVADAGGGGNGNQLD
jgi:hypothetical protein